MKKTLFLSFLFCTSMISIYAQKFIVGSYNIRQDNKDDDARGDGWKQRYPIVAQLIKFNDFDIIGLQEVYNHQLHDLLNNLPEYNYVGVGRNDGKTAGEYSPVFYKKEKFELLSSGTFWLSEDTTRPNKGWDAALPRICSWSQLKDKTSQTDVYFFNLHMDHIGIVARRESAKLVLKKIKEIAKDSPAVLVGDFNVDQTDESYKLLHDSSILNDSYEVAKVVYANNGTFNAFDINMKTDERIDHVFISPNFSVERYGILTDTYHSKVKDSDATEPKYQMRLPSDHYPVKVILEYNKK